MERERMEENRATVLVVFTGIGLDEVHRNRYFWRKSMTL